MNNIPTLVRVMAWRRTGDKPLSEPMIVRLPTHICVTRPLWVLTRLGFGIILFKCRSIMRVTGKCFVSSWWPWFQSRSSVLIIYICMCIPHMSSVIGHIYIYIYIYIYIHNGSVIQCWRSCTPSRSIGLYFWGVRGSWADCHFLFSLVYQLCLALWYKSNTRMLVTFGICFKQHFVTRYLVFYNPSPPRMFLSLDLLWEYRIQHGPLYVISSYSTWIFCRGVSGFATDCPCGVSCRELTTCLLHVGPPFGNRIFWKYSWAVDLTLWIINLIFCVFWHMQLYMSWYIRSFIGFTFLNIFSSTFVLASSIDVVVILSIVV